MARRLDVRWRFIKRWKHKIRMGNRENYQAGDRLRLVCVRFYNGADNVHGYRDSAPDAGSEQLSGSRSPARSGPKHVSLSKKARGQKPLALLLRLSSCCSYRYYIDEPEHRLAVFV